MAGQISTQQQTTFTESGAEIYTEILAPILAPALENNNHSSELPNLVLLHGWGRSSSALKQLGEILAVQYRVILVDLPGFGRSPLPSGASNQGGGWDTKDYAAQVEDLLSKLGVKRCVIVGHSFGGRITLHLASKLRELVCGVVLVGSHGLSRKRPFLQELRVRAIKSLVSTAKAIDGAIGSRLFAHYLAPRFGSSDYKAAGDLRKTLVKTVNEDSSQVAAAIKSPTLLLWGAQDRETPRDLAHQFHQLITGSELHVFPNKGHEPFADVGSHLVATYILKFIDSNFARR